MTPTEEAVNRLQKMSLAQQLETLNTYFHDCNTDLQIVIEAWKNSSDIITCNLDVLDDLNEMLDIAHTSDEIHQNVMKEIDRDWADPHTPA